MAEEMRSPIESGCPDAFQYMHPVMRKNFGQWAYHEDIRFQIPFFRFFSHFSSYASL